MNLYGDNNDPTLDTPDQADGQSTMAVLNTLGGGEDVAPEGEPLGLDAVADKPKMSGSTLAVGVVIVLGAAALMGMRMTLGAIAGGNNPIEDITQIENFLQTQQAAVKAGAEGPIKAADQESARVLEELRQDPTEHQVPADEVETNPFDFSNIVTRQPKPPGPGGDTAPAVDPVAVATADAKRRAAQLEVDSISGNMAFINGELYRVGEKIGDTGFTLDAIDGLRCIIKTTDGHNIKLAIVYK
ncbi:MAG: hypothetical protein ACE37H_09825 [Phycisphaeraceae bacterium]